MDYNHNSKYHPTTTPSAENEVVANKLTEALPEKSILNDPLFYVALVVVGIAGFFATRKATNNIQRNRLRNSRRFQGSEATLQNGQYYWEEEEFGIGS